MTKTKCDSITFSVTFYDTQINLPPTEPSTTHPGLSNSTIQTIQSLMLYLGFWEKFSKAFCSGNLYTQYRDTCDSSSWKRTTLNLSQVLSEVYLPLIVMSHLRKLAETISRTLSEKDLYILLTTLWFIPQQPCKSNRSPCDHHCISELLAGPFCHLKLHPLAGRSTISPSPCSLHRKLTETSSPIRKKGKDEEKNPQAA